MSRDIKYRLIYDSMLIDWRYSHSPYHIVLFQHCLMNAFYKDTDDISKGSFKTSVAKLSKASSISHSKIKMILKDLSSGPNPELLIDTNNSQYGYTKITVLNFDLYQLNPSGVKGSHKKPTPWSQENHPMVTENLPPGHGVATRGGHEVATKEYEVLLLKNTTNNTGVDVVSSSTAVGFSFEDLIEVYPKVNTHTVETKELFNKLTDDEKKKCVTFARQLQKIWKQNGIQEKYQYLKNCNTFVKDKMFNGKPNDIFPREIATEVIDELTQEELDWIQANKNKYITPIEKYRLENL